MILMDFIHCQFLLVWALKSYKTSVWLNLPLSAFLTSDSYFFSLLILKTVSQGVAKSPQFNFINELISTSDKQKITPGFHPVKSTASGL